MYDTQDESKQAIDLLRSGNMELADKLKTLIHKVIDKANTLVDETENANELMTLMRTAEIAAKSMGLAPTESVSNVQINAISGFIYVLDDDEPTRQVTIDEIYKPQLV
jgi:hypothetical protein